MPTLTNCRFIRYLPWGLGLCLLATVLLIGLQALPKRPLWAYYPKSTAFYARHGELLRLTLAADGQYRLWTPLHDIPETVRNATLLYEDRWFYRHSGFNVWALARAGWATFVQGGRRGGSTITMQLARHLYALDSRTLPGKLHQIVMALWLELRYSKDEILEAYLNSVSYGGNIVGIGAAARIYFHKPAAQLKLPEALALAVIPQNPARRYPGRHQRLPEALLTARARLWQHWLETFPDDRRYAAAFALPLAVHRKQDLGFAAPHFTDLLLQRCRKLPTLASSLRLDVQRSLERSLEAFLTLNRSKGIRNAAAMLLDANTMQVQALAGSANYWDAEILGQINGALAKRSPGSTLKPFVYALAMDQGLVHPLSMLADLPTAFGPYSPENFDGRFMGPVTVRDALLRSRNVPAVAVAGKLAAPTLYQFLQRAGVAQLRPEPHYGLSLALGGGEVTMEELAELYALLVNRGELRPIRYCAEDPVATPVPLLSSAAAYIALDMLKANLRPDTKRPASPDTAWKTGTSWGFRDAWTAGVAGHYVLVVWVGNFDGSRNPAFVGIKAAAPLFFAILDNLRNQRLLKGLDAPLPASKPDTVTQVEVCAASGELPNPECPVRSKTWFIPGVSPIKTSTLHRAVYFDPSTGQVVCPGRAGSRKEVFEFWDSAMLRLFERAGMPRRQAPKLLACYHAGPTRSADAPRIVSPSAAGTYALRIGKPSTIALKAATPLKGSIYWFADNSFIATTEGSETYSWTPSRAGTFQISAVDAEGRSTSRGIRVELVP